MVFKLGLVKNLDPCDHKSGRTIPDPPQAATLGRAGPAPHWGSSTESTLLAQGWVSQP